MSRSNCPREALLMEGAVIRVYTLSLSQHPCFRIIMSTCDPQSISLPISFYHSFKKKKNCGVWLIYIVVPVSAVQQNDSGMYMYTLLFIFLSILLYHRVYSSLCSTSAVGPCLSILDIIVCIYYKLPDHPSLFPFFCSLPISLIWFRLKEIDFLCIVFLAKSL